MANIAKLEINKPSELCQIVYVESFKKEYKVATLSNMQIDLVNVLLYTAREYFVTTKTELDLESPGTWFDINLNNVATMIGKYQRSEFKEIVSALDSLSNIKIVMNALGKNKEHVMTIARFIQEIEVTKKGKASTIRVAMSNEVLNKMLNVKKLFSKMFLKLQFSLSSKYSKLLYEILKDYERIKTLTINYDDLMDLLNVTVDSQKDWYIFRVNILEKAIREINEKTDIEVSYEPIKEKIGAARKRVTKINFYISQQPQTRLTELGIVDDETNEILKLYARRKFDALPPYFKKTISSPEAYINKIIQQDQEEFQDMVKLDAFIIENKKDIDISSDQPITVVLLETVSDQYYVIDNEYRLINILDKTPLTKNATETRNQINEWIAEETLGVTGMELGIKDDWTNSTVNI